MGYSSSELASSSDSSWAAARSRRRRAAASHREDFVRFLPVGMYIGTWDTFQPLVSVTEKCGDVGIWVDDVFDGLLLG